jgi:hypothetical protein
MHPVPVSRFVAPQLEGQLASPSQLTLRRTSSWIGGRVTTGSGQELTV